MDENEKKLHQRVASVTLNAWLNQHDAKLIASYDSSRAMFGVKLYVINMRHVFAIQYPDGGWNLFTALDDLSSVASLADAEERLGLNVASELADIEKRWARLSLAEREAALGRALDAGWHPGNLRDFYERIVSLLESELESWSPNASMRKIRQEAFLDKFIEHGVTVGAFADAGKATSIIGELFALASEPKPGPTMDLEPDDNVDADAMLHRAVDALCDGLMVRGLSGFAAVKRISDAAWALLSPPESGPGSEPTKPDTDDLTKTF